MFRAHRHLPIRLVLATGATGALLVASGCSSSAGDVSAQEPAGVDAATIADSAPAATGTTDTTGVEGVDAAGSPGTLDDLGSVGTLSSGEVHAIDVDVDTDDFAAMVDEYVATGEKEWIVATVTIDGERFEQVGLRLKGNSSLRGVSADATPESLPWLIRLDKYVDGQSLDGLSDLVVRSNTTATALNEAVALELLSLAGLASQDSIGVAFTVNDSDEVYRLVLEHPDDAWMAEELDEGGALYKAESTGDYSYRGGDPDAYDEVFDQEAGDDNADLDPLIDFLDFVDNSDDETFAAELADRLDVDAFATYLAMQQLIDNFDDIDGPGNNSYLYYDPDADRFTVVAWDHNLAFGVMNGGGGDFDRGGPEGGFGGRDREPPASVVDPDAATSDGADLPIPGDPTAPLEVADTDAGAPFGQVPPIDGGEGGRGGPPTGGGQRGGPGGSNVLTERYLANSEWSALVDERTEELRAALYDSGIADSVLDSWSHIVSTSGLVADADIADDVTRIASHF